MIVLGNEKGGSGKSTTAVHIAMALESAGLKVAVADCDHRQKSTARYLENRLAWAKRHDLPLTSPPVVVLEDGETDRLDELIAGGFDAVIIDTPGRDSEIGRAAIARADTLVTPINDSFIDFDLLGQVDPDSFKVTKPSFYSELVWKARQQRARADGGTVDWVVLRNRLSSLEARNRKRVGGALDELSKRIGFRVAPGLSERVIFRELFPRGLTLLDMAYVSDASVSHVAARAELRELIASLQLPLANRGAQEAVA
ncbi:division plane positioning ATPase MipZ [Sandaracinobacteroides hominis]|uniref:division plane positioning ATPase MipZ n=1 Tax=Sandaracinobacteroides hominis TaxID=2780086 RepID=UPI002E284317|nr:division plane positioning ATPase MipZ [Sandaracinobacteroides hominis]